MRIVLFRHGTRVADNLTASGKNEVELIGKQLKSFTFKKIYSSPTNRCVQTSKILSKILNNLPIETIPDLTERFQLNHLPTNQAEQEWWDNYMNANYAPKTNSVGETCKQYLARNHKVFKSLVKKTNLTDDVLIVAHSSTSYALASFIYKSNNVSWSKIGNANYLVFEINSKKI